MSLRCRLVFHMFMCAILSNKATSYTLVWAKKLLLSAVYLLFLLPYMEFELVKTRTCTC